MMEATPPAPFIMPEPDLLLELLIIALDAPAQLGGVDQIAECDAARQGRKPVLGRLLLALGPLDQQPFFGRFAGPLMARCNVNTHTRKPRARRICPSAICGLVLNVISSGPPALARRSSSWAQALGKYSRYGTGRLAWRLASDSVTATWQFACLPSCPQYWCDTPTECCPFLGRPVSSMIQASIGPSRGICGNTIWRTLVKTASSDQAA